MAKQSIRNGERTGLLSRIGPMLGLGLLGSLVMMAGVLVWAQTATDPGPRTGTAGAGTFQNGLTTNEKGFEPAITGQFEQPFSVSGTPSCACTATCSPNTCQSQFGLGPRYNSNSCASCHAQPAAGGSSPPSNPLFELGFTNPSNPMPSFEATNGPVLVPRFPYQISDLSLPDGLVHQLFTIQGRSDNLPGCTLAQPNFSQASSDGDLVFRQPLPTFGDGYIEIIENTDILNNLNSNLAQKQAYGIGGAANIADDGSVSRLGWKAQWRAILPASGAEENVEMGVTNEMFPTETDQTNANCITNPVPEDFTNYAYTGTEFVGTNYPWNFPEGADRSAIFIRFLEQPTPGSCVADATYGETAAQTCSNGQQQFSNAGCAMCHTVSYTTPAGSIPNMGHVKAVLYSDLLLHHMGPCLADNIVQGVAQGDMWRTPPLWNVGQRYWFLHDGRTNNIVTAIEDHNCTGNSQYPASEANQVVTKFNGLSAKNQQDLIYFLRSL
jgi:CxxC motif-containing protein (DUF1111 family)